MALYNLKEKKNPYDIYVDNNKKVNSQLYDLSGTVTVPLAGAALENAQTESEYLASTGGTNHNLYNLEAKKELNAQVSEQKKQAGTLYDLSKPTYGVKGKQLYDLGLNNSGYGKRLYDLNEEGYKKNLYDIAEGEKSAQQQIEANTEALKNQNLYNYSQYLSKYYTVLDAYEKYENEGLDKSLIPEKLLKDGYTADQIGAVDMLRNERDAEYPTGKYRDEGRAKLLSDLEEGLISKEYAQAKLLELYDFHSDSAKIAEDVKNGILPKEYAEAQAHQIVNVYKEQGASVPLNVIDEWEENGIVAPEFAEQYRAETQSKQAELAVQALDSPEKLDEFLATFGGAIPTEKKGTPAKTGNLFQDAWNVGKIAEQNSSIDATEAYKKTLAFDYVVSLAEQGTLEKYGKNSAEVITAFADKYTEAIKEASEGDAQMMLDKANELYKLLKSNPMKDQSQKLPNQVAQDFRVLEAVKKAVGGMYVDDGMNSVYENFNIDVKDGIINLGNYAAMVQFGDPDAGDPDFAPLQKKAIQEYIKARGIEVTYYRPEGSEKQKRLILTYRGTEYDLPADTLTEEAAQALTEYGIVYDSASYISQTKMVNEYKSANRKTGKIEEWAVPIK